MDQFTFMAIAAWAAWALGFVVGLLILYWVIRLAVTHSLRSHHLWVARLGRLEKYDG
jgi:uncharacterized membrane-anchored protein YhcB (DUF1043 family)